MRESSLVKKIQSYCKKNNIWCVKIWGGGYQSGGIPDLILCVDGLFVAIETKVDDNKLSCLQEYNIKKIRQSNGEAAEIRSMEEFMDLINKVKTFKKAYTLFK